VFLNIYWPLLSYFSHAKYNVNLHYKFLTSNFNFRNFSGLFIGPYGFGLTSSDRVQA